MTLTLNLKSLILEFGNLIFICQQHDLRQNLQHVTWPKSFPSTRDLPPPFTKPIRTTNCRLHSGCEPMTRVILEENAVHAVTAAMYLALIVVPFCLFFKSTTTKRRWKSHMRVQEKPAWFLYFSSSKSASWVGNLSHKEKLLGSLVSSLLMWYVTMQHHHTVCYENQSIPR